MTGTSLGLVPVTLREALGDSRAGAVTLRGIRRDFSPKLVISHPSERVSPPLEHLEGNGDVEKPLEATESPLQHPTEDPFSQDVCDEC